MGRAEVPPYIMLIPVVHFQKFICREGGGVNNKSILLLLITQGRVNCQTDITSQRSFQLGMIKRRKNKLIELMENKSYSHPKRPKIQISVGQCNSKYCHPFFHIIFSFVLQDVVLFLFHCPPKPQTIFLIVFPP